MAISRAQIPEQIDVFAPGGGVGTDNSSLGGQSLANQLIERLSDYDANVGRYQQRLSQYAPERPKMNIFEVASELGRGLLATPNTGVGSAYRGLGVGFDNVSQKLKEDRDRFEKERREIGMLASQMAMQDEQRAKTF